MQQPDGLAVLGFVYEVKKLAFVVTNFTPFLLLQLDSGNETSNAFVPLLSQVIEPKSTYTESQNMFTLRDVIKTNEFEFLSYNGSLTTPNCYETVTWLVSLSFLSISPKDLEALRGINDEKHNQLETNFRPLQKLNRRQVNLHQTVRTFDDFNSV